MDNKPVMTVTHDPPDGLVDLIKRLHGMRSLGVPVPVTTDEFDLATMWLRPTFRFARQEVDRLNLIFCGHVIVLETPPVASVEQID